MIIIVILKIEENSEIESKNEKWKNKIEIET